ncbi:MAG: DUF1211 domain-containing protein [Mucilaginibacter polytrichastri]|nr:DUF1211 domain-containing protein [Mucilaginibacter polytrichastri]
MSETSENTAAIREEVAKEFQVERLILFSDAVFAIVITLVAIEIRMPEMKRDVTLGVWMDHFLHLIPSFFAYAISFYLIGRIWYRHLQLFGFVRSYDAGLVIRNLLVLFFIGLFPFSISLITSGRVFYPPYFVYIFLVFAGEGAQLLLKHYVLVQRPQLRNTLPVHNALVQLRISRRMFLALCVIITLTVTSYFLIPDDNLKPVAFWWMMLLPVISAVLRRRFAREMKTQAT